MSHHLLFDKSTFFTFQILLDVDGEADDVRELERRGAEQLPVRERGAGALPRALEPGRQGPPVERHPLLLRDLLRLRGLRRRKKCENKRVTIKKFKRGAGERGVLNSRSKKTLCRAKLPSDWNLLGAVRRF